MPGVLSQREIDSLLSALPIETETPQAARAARQSKPVKVYDFRHPDKFSKDQLRTLENLHDQFARRLGTSLSAHLRTLVQVELAGIEPGVYDDFIQQVPNPAVLYVVSLDPLPGRAVLELHPNVAFIIIDRLLGGFGKGLSKARELTDVEQTLLETVVWEILGALKEAWSNITAVSPKLGEIASTPQFLQVALPTDIVLTISFDVRVIENTGTMRLCLPYVVLEPIVSQLTAQAIFAGSRKVLEPAQARQLRRHVERAKLPVVVVLGSAEVTINELLHLQKGDVIPLDARANQPLEIRVAGEPKYLGRPGLIGRRLAMQITGVPADEGDEDAAE